MIEIKHLYKTYPGPQGPIPALVDINLAVSSGQILGVIGRSGAGKSTLIRCINGLESPSAGTVVVSDQHLNSTSGKALRQLRQQIGMVFQHFNLLSRRTVYDNVALPLELIHFSKVAIRERVEPLLELTGLSDKRLAYPHQLSGGQRQRVAIARALSTQPKVLLCDEMTSALDPETTHSVLQLIKKINQELNLAILLITHEMQVVKVLADHVAVMDQGKIIEQASVYELFAHPKTPTACALTKAASMLPPTFSPEVIAKLAGDHGQLWCLTYLGISSAEPLIEQLIRQYAVHLNIIQAHLELLQNQTLGMMTIKISGDSDQLTQAKFFLQQHGVQVENISDVAINV